MKELFNNYVQQLETYIMIKIKMEAARLAPELTKRGRKPISLAMGAPVEKPPELVTKKIQEYAQTDGMHTYTLVKGEQYLLDSIAENMKNRTGVNFDAKSEICALIGSKEGIANLIRALINPQVNEKDKEIILIPDPGYASYNEMVKVSGGLGYGMPLTPENNYMPDLEKVFERLKKDGYSQNKVKAVIINYPNNPIGAMCTKEYLQKAVDFCRRHKLLLISDAAYIDLTYPGQGKAPSVFDIEGAKDTAVEFYSFSKPFSMTGWRIGWVCGNADAVTILGKLKSTIDTGIYKPIQKAAADVLNSKEGAEYIKEANARFARKQKITLDGFKAIGWPVDKLYTPKAAFYLWLPVPLKYKTSKEFTDDVLNKSGVVLVPGNAFGKHGEGWFRLSIVASEDEMKEAVRRLKEDGFRYE